MQSWAKLFLTFNNIMALTCDLYALNPKHMTCLDITEK